MIEVLDTAAARGLLERRLLRCPGCNAPLKPWGRARARTVVDHGARLLSARPDRARCTGCGATHVVLEARLLIHRGYSVSVIGQALLASAAGFGHRRIAEHLAVPADTVRGWLRRVRGSARHLYQLGVEHVVRLDPDLLPTVERTNALALVLDALGAAALAFARRFGLERSDPWARINVLTRGRLLAAIPAG